MLTLLRILLTILLGMLTTSYLNQTVVNKIHYIFILNILIYITDLLDGKLARKWNVCSKIGASLDILADLGYMTSQYYLLIRTGYMSWILLICIYLEFLIFLKTSLYYRPITKKIFLFNKIGKLVAIYYYLLPMLYLGAIYFQCGPLIFSSMDAVCVILTALAITDRVVLCLSFHKLQKKII